MEMQVETAGQIIQLIPNLEPHSLGEILTALLGGAVGSLAKDCLLDGVLLLPSYHNGKLYLGFIGGMVVGAFVGMVIDGTFTTAMLAGYAGSSIIQNLVTRRVKAEESVVSENTTTLTNTE